MCHVPRRQADQCDRLIIEQVNMEYTEADISILIPVYRPGADFRYCLESALSVSPGEIIVSINDAKNYPPDEKILKELNNSKITVFYQNNNLGIWENHLFLLRQANKRWVSFLHGDDRFQSSYLKSVICHLDDEVSIVGTLPRYHNLSTGQQYTVLQLDEPVRWNSDAYLKRAVITGMELGRPSSVVIRRDCIDLYDHLWVNDVSADYILNIKAAANGSVVLLPAGQVTYGLHQDSDGATQSFNLIYKRALNSANLLAKDTNGSIQKIGRMYGLSASSGLLYMLAGRVVRCGDFDVLLLKSLAMFMQFLLRSLLARDNPLLLIKNLAWKYNSNWYGPRTGRNIKKLQM